MTVLNIPSNTEDYKEKIDIITEDTTSVNIPTKNPPPKALNSIVFHHDLTKTQKLQFMVKNLLYIFTYTLVISISLALGKIITVLMENKSKEQQLFYSFLNLFILIIITVFVTYSLGAEVML